jgi:RNA polymerase sigma-70 factor (ECF subfamily)
MDPWPAGAQQAAAQRRLFTKAHRGDTAALRELWQINRRWIAGVLLAYKPRHAELDDLLQEVALTMVRKIDAVREPEALTAWLRAVAINTARLAARSEQRRPEHKGASSLRARNAGPVPLNDDALADSTAFESDLVAARREEGQRLLNSVLALPEAYREPVLLRSVKGMSYREISAITGLPETTIETRIARGRRMLRDQLRNQSINHTPTQALKQASHMASDMPSDAVSERTHP